MRVPVWDILLDDLDVVLDGIELLLSDVSFSRIATAIGLVSDAGVLLLASKIESVECDFLEFGFLMPDMLRLPLEYVS